MPLTDSNLEDEMLPIGQFSAGKSAMRCDTRGFVPAYALSEIHRETIVEVSTDRPAVASAVYKKRSLKPSQIVFQDEGLRKLSQSVASLESHAG